jgi:hypothetical protein
MASNTLFEQIFSEDVPLLARQFFEQGSNVRHLLPEFKTWAKENKDRKFLNYLLTKSTIADARDWLIEYHKSRGIPNVSGRLRKTINEWLYSLPPSLLQFWYGKYGEAFIDVFRMTRPRPDRWKLPWFQEACFGGDVPDDSIIASLRKIRKEGGSDLATHLKEGVPWHYLRQTWPVADHIAIYVRHAPLRFVIERMEHYINNPRLIEIAIKRLEGTPRINVSVILNAIETHLSPTRSLTSELRYDRFIFPELLSSMDMLVIEDEPEDGELFTKVYNALLERDAITIPLEEWVALRNLAHTSQSRLRMKLIDTAQNILTRGYIDTKHIGKTAILIDKSGSMENAIDLGSTLAGLISARIPDAATMFFDSPDNITESGGIYPENSPSNVLQMIEMRQKWHASGGTVIYPSLEWLGQTGPYDTIFVVSDGNVWDFAERSTLSSGLKQWGATPDHMGMVRGSVNKLPSANWIFVKMKCPDQYNADPNPFGRLLEDDAFMGRSVTYVPRGAEDAETILGIASYFANHGLMSALQRVREDIIDYADTPKYKRQRLVPRVALTCPRCNAATSPEIEHCLYCGGYMEKIPTKGDGSNE